jgi:uncharacterized protein YqjF (DUF2071 family)
MHHCWRHLTFLHWTIDPVHLQRLLPPGLTVDTHEGSAYIGLVPFTMHGIRISGLPAVPGLRASHETNVRTYVVDERGVPGVWFFCLDAANPVFVHTARAWYRLPYVRSKMTLELAQGSVTYASSRRWPRGVVAGCRVEATYSGDYAEPQPGSLEFFLVERYVLFAYGSGRLYEGRVWHAPYKVCPGNCISVEEDMLKALQIERPDEPPHVLHSPGVDVDVYSLRRAEPSR